MACEFACEDSTRFACSLSRDNPLGIDQSPNQVEALKPEHMILASMQAHGFRGALVKLAHVGFTLA